MIFSAALFVTLAAVLVLSVMFIMRGARTARAPGCRAAAAPTPSMATAVQAAYPPSSAAPAHTTATVTPKLIAPACSSPASAVSAFGPTLPGPPGVGTVLEEKYRLDRRLSDGGTSSVFAGRHRCGNRVAVKVANLDTCADPDRVRRFLQEARAANDVPHPGKARVLDDGVTPAGAPYLVLDFVEGIDLFRWLALRGGRASVEEALTIADQILDVLSAAHGQGILHRDIKPGNVMVTPAGTVVVLDFGLAYVESSARRLTREGVPMGTPGYMPPEQARGRFDLVDISSETWAVGAVMFEMLTGQPPHGTGSALELLVAAATQPAPSVRALRGDVPPEVAAIVDRALAFAKACRFLTAAEMQGAIRTVRKP